MAIEIPDYEQEIQLCVQFLSEFERAPSPEDNLFQREESRDHHQSNHTEGVPEKIYFNILKNQIARRQRQTITISLDDVLKFTKDVDFICRIERNALRYRNLFCEAIDKIIPPSDVECDLKDVFDVLRGQRLQTQASSSAPSSLLEEEEEATPSDAFAGFPRELLRRYQVCFKPRQKQQKVAIRQVLSSSVGRLVTITGIITRVTEVKPLVLIVTYTCDVCGHEIYQEVNSKTFTPLTECPSKRCKAAQSKGKLHMQTRGCKFVSFQDARLQEMPEEVPVGHIPRTIPLHFRGDLTRSVLPGDRVTLSGIFLPTPFSGFRALKAGLIADTYLEVCFVLRHKQSYTNYELTSEMEDVIRRSSQEPEVYTKLSSSIAPEIFGHEDVKKALLLLMVGAPTRVMADGMKIRGELNICLMGDPGVAKSQLLKHVSSISPRGVYTSGKCSTGVGLTAAVVRDPLTGEFVLEGGSLVLSDMGVCCIDEFDKMDDSDRTAIHEVMEQQTISIAKAGITTTLNARTSILAAANPAYGRYNPNVSPSENINLPAALLSRFDLMFVILDKHDSSQDIALAKHVLYVHQNLVPPPLSFDTFSSEFIRGYVSIARRIKPFVPRKLTEYITGAYVNMRLEELRQADQSMSYITARTLLGVLRLSQALARLRLSNQVTQADVDEAMRLIHMSKASLEKDSSSRSGQMDPMSAIYTITRDHLAKSKDGSVAYSDVLPSVLSKGYSQHQLDECLDEYANLNVWIVSSDRYRISIV